MQPNSRRLMAALAVSMLFLIVWMQIIQRKYPMPQPATQTATADSAAQPAIVPGSGAPAVISAEGSAASQPTSAMASAEFAASGGTGLQLFELGRDTPAAKTDANAYWLAVKVSSLGASVEDADLTQYRNTVASDRNAPPETYDLLRPQRDLVGEANRNSFATPSIRLVDAKETIELGVLDWRARAENDARTQRVVFDADVTHAGAPLLRIRKTYQLSPGTADLKLRIEVDNVSGKSINFALTQEGPLGITSEVPGVTAARDDRYVISGFVDGASTTAVPHMRMQVFKAEKHQLDLLTNKEARWLAQVNKWFAAIMTPVKPGSGRALSLVNAHAVARTGDENRLDDMRISMVLQPEGGPLAKGLTAALDYDIYLGPKDHRRFISDPAYAARGYDTILDATGGSCAILTFHWLTGLMRWLLAFLHKLPPHNYGLSIILLVLIVRVLLHGITKRNQLYMMRMQRKMATVGPRLEALKARCKDDPAELNKQTMQLYREAGISPFAQVTGCLPTLIQMPIWVALWTTLNTTIDLRHEPFMLWMRDLAAPDALIKFSRPYEPFLISAMTGPIAALNVLPIVMAITMYLQQKLTAKLTRDPKVQPTDQQKQQQKMMSYMTLFFALMFYSFPCGLNLYIFTSNVFGMLEQWIIRREIHQEDIETRPAGASGEPKPRKPRPRWMESIARRIQEAQKMAEQARRQAKSGSDPRAPKRRPGRG